MKLEYDVDMATIVAVATFVCGILAFGFKHVTGFYANKNKEAARESEQENTIEKLRESLQRAWEDIHSMNQQIDLVQKQVQEQALANASTKTEIVNLQRMSLRTEATVQELLTLIVKMTTAHDARP